MFNQSRQTLQAVCQIQPALTETSSSTRFIHPSRAWNDKKVTAHHAIIPTLKSTAAGKLSDSEFKVYDLVARQYLMQFLPDYEYRHIQIDSRLEGGLFCTRKVESVSLGWKVALYRRPNESENKALDKTPALKPGDAVTCLETHIRAKNTTPPNHFNDATLLSAMTGISRFVSDPSIRKVLRETDGIGTEATRASIIELLLKRGFLTRQKKHILSTKLGRQLIQSLPSYVTLPDMTAHWESKLEKVSNKKLCYQDFMEPMITELKQLIGYMNTMSFKQLENDHPSQRPKKIKKRVSKKAGLMS